MTTLSSQNLAVAKLYVALMSRAPDANGFTFWVQAHASGASLASLAQTMLGSAEALAWYPAEQSNAQFVTGFYTSVFGRAPDADGLAFWSAALAAQGGAGSLSARAALVLQIADIASTPLAGRPAGMSDAAYQQTVADRARFINKAEFGVYFASELKSNDLTLAKAALARVTDDAGSLNAAINFANGIVPAEPSVPGILVITAADSAPDITNKFAAYAYSSATVNATGMDAAQLNAVAAAVGKIAADGITGTLALDVLSDATTVALLPKGSGLHVVATGASATEVALLADNIGRLASDGVTGTVNLTNALSAAQLGNLLGAKMALTANVVVDAAGMTDSVKLGTVLAGIAKVDAINKLSIDLSTLEDSVSVAWLGKVGTGTIAAVTGATAVEIAKVVEKISSFASGGLSGAMTLSAGQLSSASAPVLGAKLASGFALTVLGDAASDVINLSSLTQGVTVSGGAGVDTISLSGGSDMAILGTQAETRSQLILATDTDTLKIDKIDNVERTDKIRLSTAPDAYGEGITFSDATVLGGSHATYLPQLAATEPLATFADLFATLNSEVLGAILPVASTNAVAQVAYIYFSHTGSSLKGGYLVINNQDAVFDQNDTIISLSGSLLVGDLSQIGIMYKDMFVFV